MVENWVGQNQPVQIRQRSSYTDTELVNYATNGNRDSQGSISPTGLSGDTITAGINAAGIANVDR